MAMAMMARVGFSSSRVAYQQLVPYEECIGGSRTYWKMFEITTTEGRMRGTKSRDPLRRDTELSQSAKDRHCNSVSYVIEIPFDGLSRLCRSLT